MIHFSVGAVSFLLAVLLTINGEAQTDHEAAEHSEHRKWIDFRIGQDFGCGVDHTRDSARAKRYSEPVVALAESLSNIDFGYYVAGDFLASWSEKTGRAAGADGFQLRGVEWGLSAQVDDFLELRTSVFVDEEEIELEEAYAALYNKLPGGLVLRAGRFNLGFGQQSGLHDHALSSIDKATVLQEFLGGTVRGTGAELRGSLSMVNFVVGVLQSADSDGHVLLGPASDQHAATNGGSPANSIREVDDFALFARSSIGRKLDSAAVLQMGASVLYVPTIEIGVDVADEYLLTQTVLGFDLSYSRDFSRDGQGLKLQGEWLYSDRENGAVDNQNTAIITDDVFAVSRAHSTGLFALGEYRHNENWRAGLSGSWYEQNIDDEQHSWDIGLFLTHAVNDYNQIRYEVRSFENLGTESRDFVSFAVQWLVLLGQGSHHQD